MTLNNFLLYAIFGGRNTILDFWTTCTCDKKLCYGLVKDKNMCFYPIPLHPVCPVYETVL